MSFNPTRPFDLPALPPVLPTDDPAILRKLLDARVQLAELKGLSVAMPNPMILVSPLTALKESVASSEIEAIHTTFEAALQQELFPEVERRAEDKEVLRYRDALLWGYAYLEKVALSSRLILGIHEHLITNAPGVYRKLQNAVGNKATGQAVYTPPESQRVPDLIRNWENFANGSDAIDPVIRAAVAHYQFEAIHPFTDGNGRVGRILMVLHFVAQGVLQFPTLYISGYLNRNRPAYYEVLRSVSSTGDWRVYLDFMLSAFAEQARSTKTTLTDVMQLHEATRRKVQAKLKAIYSRDLVDHIFSTPITTPVRISEALGLHYTTGSKYLAALAKAGVLSDERRGKYHFYFNDSLISVLKR